MTDARGPAPERIAARALLERTLDPGSYRSWDREPLDVATVGAVAGAGLDPGYAADLARARERSGTDEAVLTGEGRLRGHRVAVVASEFAFLAGSIGVAAAERLVHAVERATEERLPLLVSPSSGGTRMQEGTVAFLQMIAITQAVAEHKRAGLPYLVYLRHPTTGGVLASWGSLGQVTAAQPGALIGFLGPRVYEILHGEPFPSGVQVAENLAAKGLIDAVVPPEELRELAGRVLDVLARPPGGGSGGAAPAGAVQGHAGSRGAGAEDDAAHARADDGPRGLPAWESVRISRRPDRPGVRRFLRHAAADVVPLHGTGEGEADPGVFLGLVRVGARPFVILGQDRRGQEHEPMGPAALREARRGMRLAEELDLPLVTVIDTPGAVLSRDGEERAMAGEIARALSDLATLPVPTVAVMLGEGTGGGALAFVPADRVIAAEHAWLAPLPPEGASAIVHRDSDHAAAMADQQGVRAVDLQAAGLVDLVVPERPDAADEPEAFCRRLGRHLERVLAELAAEDPQRRRERRNRRYRQLGGLRPRSAPVPPEAPPGFGAFRGGTPPGA